ncbi:hypothetical protein [Tenacibaculum singaporense]|uniref:Uncharacterized protein n=1 Tax=Tenacibaculum singaporense TaxID=2358479 RepID=A0A3S8R6E8_9FLAO|nr:hypothetical protein [Tenacibaculum singaporense]AZJ35360.1 hypothetical protein D6T69_07420 [Tenacibaculum singaporense]
MERIAVAGNIEAPIYKLLLDKGFKISIQGEYWVAKNNNFEAIADNIIELTGIIYLRENKGKNWKASDDVIDNYIDFLKMNEK